MPLLLMYSFLVLLCLFFWFTDSPLRNSFVKEIVNYSKQMRKTFTQFKVKRSCNAFADSCLIFSTDMTKIANVWRFIDYCWTYLDQNYNRLNIYYNQLVSRLQKVMCLYTVHPRTKYLQCFTTKNQKPNSRSFFPRTIRKFGSYCTLKLSLFFLISFYKFTSLRLSDWNYQKLQIWEW